MKEVGKVWSSGVSRVLQPFVPPDCRLRFSSAMTDDLPSNFLVFLRWVLCAADFRRMNYLVLSLIVRESRGWKGHAW